MNRIALFVVLMMVSPSLAFGQGKVKLPKIGVIPPQPQPLGAFKLPADMLYVIESDEPHLVLDSPQKIVSVTPSGPLTIFARFADGSGKYERRDYKSKHVWLVQATGKGNVELLIVPDKAKYEDVTRVQLMVDAGVAPLPPPDPPGKVVKSLTFLVIGPTPRTAAVTENAEFRAWLKENAVGIFGISTKAQQDANPKFAGIPSPSLVLQDADNIVIGYWPLVSVDDAKAVVSIYLRK